MHPSTHLSHFWERLHQLHPLCVDLNEGQQIPGLNRLKQLDHFSCRGRARLPRVLVVHIFSVDELLPHRPVFRRRGSQRGVDIKRIEFSGSSESTHMSLDGVGFGEGEERFPSMISLKLLFPMFLASWGGGRRKSQHLLSFHHSFIISNNSPEVKIVKGVHRCLRNTIYSLDGAFLGLTKSSDVPSLSSSIDWIREMWTPISRWMPEHSMQVRIPRLVDSHLGSINTDNTSVLKHIIYRMCRWKGVGLVELLEVVEMRQVSAYTEY